MQDVPLGRLANGWSCILESIAISCLLRSIFYFFLNAKVIHAPRGVEGMRPQNKDLPTATTTTPVLSPTSQTYSYNCNLLPPSSSPCDPALLSSCPPPRGAPPPLGLPADGGAIGREDGEIGAREAAWAEYSGRVMWSKVEGEGGEGLERKWRTV